MQSTGKPNNARPKKKRNADETATLIIPQITPEIIARAREAMAQGMSAEEAAKLATAEAAEAAAAKAAAKADAEAEAAKAAAKSRDAVRPHPRSTPREAAVSAQPRKRDGVHPGVSVKARPQTGPRPIATRPTSSTFSFTPPTVTPASTQTAEVPSPVENTATIESTATVENTATIENTATRDSITTAPIDATAAYEVSAQAPTAAAATADRGKRSKKTAKQSSSKSGPRTMRQAEADLFRSIHDDHLWLNNPVMVRGLGLAPAVMAATDGDNALMLCMAAVLLITFTRVLAVAICHLTGNRHRPFVYAYSAALVYIPIYILVFEIFGSSLTVLGIFLPLLCVDPVVLKRIETNSLETVEEALRRGFNNSIGYCIALMLVGIVREFLATGCFFGYKVVRFSLLPLAAQPAGGFVLIGIICAVWTAIGGSYVHYKREEVRHLYADADR